ncbi:MAG TPA: C25 family cysteine peptidase [Pirellulales bacterium]|nr:C25 family cysteine peptidase [Pirellulales bacterium]
MYWAWLTWAMMAIPGQAADTVVVCPPSFRQALAPWVEYRQSQGRRLAFVDNRGTAEQIRSAVRQASRLGKLRAVMLVGDAQGASPTGAAARDRSVPVHLARAKVNVNWGSEPEIATDNWYADLDDDQIPDVPVGRLTADSAAELSGIVRKILTYEKSRGGDVWRRRINLVAGLGGFGALADAALEAAAKAILTEGIPPSYVSSMTYASWRSPYCPDPASFNQTTLDRMNEGCLFWVYLGHGRRREVDLLHAPGGSFRIFDARDVPKLSAYRGAPIALFLSCYTGAFDGPEDCLAEEMLRAEAGPAAVICGSRVTMPYAMSVFGTELLKECFERRRTTIGEVVLEAKRNTMLKPRTDGRSRALDGLAGLLNPLPGDLAEERAEHLLLFNLLGDPLLELRHPREAKLHVRAKALAGERLEVSGECDVNGEALVELVVRRDRLTFQPATREGYRPSPETFAEYSQTYRRANDPRLSSVRVPVEDGRFAAELDVPATAWGDCHVRVFVQGDQDFAAGTADVEIRRAMKGR